MDQVETVAAEHWESWVSSNQGVVLDVREPLEWGLGTLPGALKVSMSELADKVDDLPRDRPILCVCRSGSRSAQVAAFLTMSGFDQVANLDGGMKALGMQD